MTFTSMLSDLFFALPHITLLWSLAFFAVFCRDLETSSLWSPPMLAFNVMKYVVSLSFSNHWNQNKPRSFAYPEIQGRKWAFYLKNVFILFIYVYACVCVCVGPQRARRGHRGHQILQSWSYSLVWNFLFVMWVLGSELQSPCLGNKYSLNPVKLTMWINYHRIYI